MFRRDNHTCTNCGWHDPTAHTLECDHIGNRLDHSPANLTTLCGKGSPLNCHGTKTKQQAAAGRRGRTR